MIIAVDNESPCTAALRIASDTACFGPFHFACRCSGDHTEDRFSLCYRPNGHYTPCFGLSIWLLGCVTLLLLPFFWPLVFLWTLSFTCWSGLCFEFTVLRVEEEASVVVIDTNGSYTTPAELGSQTSDMPPAYESM
jgi:hypothetical protein